MRLSKPNKAFIDIVKGTGTAAGLSVAAVLLLALGLRALPIGDEAIPVINQVVKVVSVALGSLVAVGRGGERGLPKGAAVGALYTILGTAVYMLLDSGSASPVAALADMGLGTAAGAIAGVLAANLTPVKQKSTKSRPARA